MKVLVTGGAGLLGAAVARRLLDAGHRVRIADAFAADGDGRSARGARAAALKERGAEVRRVDLGEAPFVQELLEELVPDVIVHAARLPAQADVRPLVGVAAAIGVGLYVHVSDADLYGEAPGPAVRAAEDEPLAPGGDPRLRARVEDEAHVRDSGLPFVVLRCFELVSDDLLPGRLGRDVADCVREGRAVPLPDEEGRDLLHVDDAARAVHLAITKRPLGRTLNLGSGTGISLRVLAQEIGRNLGREPLFAPAPPPARPPRVADTTAVWDALRFGAEIPFPRIAADLASARAAHPPARPAAAGEKPARSPALSRREIFGIFRKPFDGRK